MADRRDKWMSLGRALYYGLVGATTFTVLWDIPMKQTETNRHLRELRKSVAIMERKNKRRFENGRK